jgi:3-dehydroquinate synthase
MAEVIKAGCIADRDLFTKVAGGRPEDLAPIIQRCVEIKAEVVQADPFEQNGRRATLNFGHTLGHAIENAAGYGVLLHGEAVAIGLRAAAHLSQQKCGLSSAEVASIEAALLANHLPLTVSGISRETVRSALKLDKKAHSGVNRWVLLPRLGETVLRDDIKPGDVEALLDLVLN